MRRNMASHKLLDFPPRCDSGSEGTNSACFIPFLGSRNRRHRSAKQSDAFGTRKRPSEMFESSTVKIGSSCSYRARNSGSKMIDSSDCAKVSSPKHGTDCRTVSKAVPLESRELNTLGVCPSIQDLTSFSSQWVPISRLAATVQLREATKCR